MMTADQRRLMIAHGWKVWQDLTFVLPVNDYEYNSERDPQTPAGKPAHPPGYNLDGHPSVKGQPARSTLADIDKQIADLNAQLDDLHKTPIVNPPPGWQGPAYAYANTPVEDYEYRIRRECSADRSKAIDGG